MASFDKVLDNKNHQTFDTGSVRDSAVGKGTPHLLAGEVISERDTGIKNDTLCLLHNLLLSYNVGLEDMHRMANINIIESLYEFTFAYLKRQENDSYYEAMRRFAQHYENGAKKYSPNNWRKGQPISRYYDSAFRHLCHMIDGDTAEDHISALLWNLACILQTKKDVIRGYLPEHLNDFPFTKKELFEKAVVK